MCEGKVKDESICKVCAHYAALNTFRIGSVLANADNMKYCEKCDNLIGKIEFVPVNYESEFCTCGTLCVTTGFEDDFGYWDVCVACGKKLENGQHYYNHYDGEDHDDVDFD